VATQLQGSCQVPLAVFARMQDGHLHVSALVGTPDGKEVLRSDIEGAAEEVDALSFSIALDLLEQGADRIISALA